MSIATSKIHYAQLCKQKRVLDLPMTLSALKERCTGVVDVEVGDHIHLRKDVPPVSFKVVGHTKHTPKHSLDLRNSPFGNPHHLRSALLSTCS